MNKHNVQSPLYLQIMETPFGQAYLYANQTKLKALLFKPWEKAESQVISTTSNAVLEKTKRQLGEYFTGERQEFNLPIDAKGTDFQHRVWKQLCQINYGETQNYGQIAEKIGNKNASRAVGMANGKNPISIIVPCHRVIGANGTLTGYAGGLEAKQWLLAHETSIINKRGTT